LSMKRPTLGTRMVEDRTRQDLSTQVLEAAMSLRLRSNQIKWRDPNYYLIS